MSLKHSDLIDGQRAERRTLETAINFCCRRLGIGMEFTGPGVLVTGVMGFVGSHLAERSLNADTDVVVVNGLSTTGCVRAICHVIEHSRKTPLRRFDIGTRTTASVSEVAATVVDVVGLKSTYEYTGGDREWTGDIPKMGLSVDRLLKTDWEPDRESVAAVRWAAEQLGREL